MNYSENFRSDLEQISSILQALDSLHQAGVDRTGRGCDAMSHLAIALESALNDLSATATLIDKTS